MPHVRGHTQPRKKPRAEPDRTLDDGPAGRPMMPTIARWPLDIDGGFEHHHSIDPWVALVRESIDSYRSGQVDQTNQCWARDIVWRVAGHGPMSREHRGPEDVFEYHRTLTRLTGGAFRQRLVALESSGGPIVEAHVRTTARRGSRRLDIPSLVVFEVSGHRIHTITEMPGDQAAWDRFWAD